MLHLTTKLNAVDVNVHPTKQEVKFGSERKVFNAVYYAVRAALEQDQTRPAAVLERPRAHDSVTPNQTRFQTMTAQQYRALTSQGAPGGCSGAPAPHLAGPLGPGADPHRPPAGRTAAPPRLHRAPRLGGVAPVSAPVKPMSAPMARTEPEAHTAPGAHPVPVVPEPEAKAETVPAPGGPPPCGGGAGALAAGREIFHTYIIVEQGERVLLIDKHAAHERMHFDRLKAEGYTPMCQMLLTPVVFTPPAEEGAVLLQNTGLLAGFGFEVEDFGGGGLIVRQCPDYVDAGDIESTLSELAGRLLATGRADPAAARDGVLHTMACKAAIKGRQKNDPRELERVARAVLSGAVKYRPHGRPVAIELTRGQLEKQFKRA